MENGFLSEDPRRAVLAAVSCRHIWHMFGVVGECRGSFTRFAEWPLNAYYHSDQRTSRWKLNVVLEIVLAS